MSLVEIILVLIPASYTTCGYWVGSQGWVG